MFSYRSLATFSFWTLVVIGLIVLFSANSETEIGKDELGLILFVGFSGVITAILSLKEKPKEEKPKITDSKKEEH